MGCLHSKNKKVSPRDKAIENDKCLYKELNCVKVQHCNVSTLIINKSNKNRQRLKDDYEEMFGEDLLASISAKSSPLFTQFCTMLLDPPSAHDAKQLHKAIKGSDSVDNDVLIDIVLSRSTAELKEIMESYSALYQRELVSDLMSTLDEMFLNLILAVIYREETDHILEQLANCKHLPDGLGKALTKYNTLPLEEATADLELHSNDESVLQLLNYLLTYTADPVAYFSMRLHSCLQEAEIEPLLHIVISRSEVNLCAILASYIALYNKGLWPDIESRITETCCETWPGTLSLLEQHSQLPDTPVKEDPLVEADAVAGNGVTNANSVDAVPAAVTDDATSAVTARNNETFNTPHASPTVEPVKATPLLVSEAEPNKTEVYTELANRIHSAPEEFGEVLFSVDDRAELATVFTKLYNQDLAEFLAPVLSSENMALVRDVIMPREQYIATCLYSAISAAENPDLTTIIEILLTTRPELLLLVKQSYEVQYSGKLEAALTNNLQGDFQRLVAALLQGARDTGPVDQVLAIQEAQQLFNCTHFTWSSDENVFTKVFLHRNPDQLAATFSQFTEIAGYDITDLIKQEFSLHLRDALLGIVTVTREGVSGYLAHKLHTSLDTSVTRVAVARDRVDLSSIRKQYLDLTMTSLHGAVEDLQRTEGALLSLLIKSNK